MLSTVSQLRQGEENATMRGMDQGREIAAKVSPLGIGMTPDRCPLCKDYHPADEGIVFFRREFVCSMCGESWSDIWCADCNDRCPRCNAEMEGHSDLTEFFVYEEPVLDTRAQTAGFS